MRKILIFCFLIVLLQTVAAQTSYTPANGHAHNDYLNARPFYEAFENGLGSIEADVYPVNGILCVAHSKKEIDLARTLDSMYLNPIKHLIASGSLRPLQLLVDIKEDYQTSLSLLQKALQPLMPYLSQPGKPALLTITISGSRPSPVAYQDYPAYIFFDDDLKLKHSPDQWARVSLVSLPFTKFSQWKGTGKISRKDRKALRHLIDSTHKAGKPFRFWAAPDTGASWKLQRKLKANLIGTDKVKDLAAWLRRQ